MMRLLGTHTTNSCLHDIIMTFQVAKPEEMMQAVLLREKFKFAVAGLQGGVGPDWLMKEGNAYVGVRPEIFEEAVKVYRRAPAPESKEYGKAWGYSHDYERDVLLNYVFLRGLLEEKYEECDLPYGPEPRWLSHQITAQNKHKIA